MDNKLYDTWSKYISTVLKSKKIPFHDAEDIKQDIFVHLLEYPYDDDKYDMKNIVLKSINQCISKYYAEKNKLETVNRGAGYDNIKNKFDDLLDKADIEDYNKSEVLLKLEECMRTLTSGQKKILDFLLNEGNSYQEYKKKYPKLGRAGFFKAKKDLKEKLIHYLHDTDKKEDT